MQTLNTIAVVIAVIGSVIIIWGVILTLFLFLKTELKKIASRQELLYEKQIRYNLISYLLLGLDFMLAADIIHTIHNPALKELYVLAMIVAIRSVISYFLHREIVPTQPDSRKKFEKHKTFL